MGSLFLVLDLTTHASLQIKRLIIAVSHWSARLHETEDR
jgi:hypothetical protein